MRMNENFLMNYKKRLHWNLFPLKEIEAHCNNVPPAPHETLVAAGKERTKNERKSSRGRMEGGKVFGLYEFHKSSMQII